MSAIAKILVPNKTWLVEDGGKKVGTLNKEKKGYTFLVKGQKIEIKKSDIAQTLGITLPETGTIKRDKESKVDHNVYDFPCSSRPHNPVYNIKKKLPIYSKSLKSKSLYCAGYYIIKFRKGWVKSYCPKLITLERYPYQGPFKTEEQMKNTLNITGKEK